MTLDPVRLWAKSKRREDEVHPSMHLEQHLCDVLESAERVLEATGDDQLRALGLAPDAYGQRLRRIVRLAAACHDLGKANDHFQSMLLRTRDVELYPQGLRHEWVSLLLLRQLKPWLLSALDSVEHDFSIFEWAVSGHHPAYNHPCPPRTCPPGAGTQIGILSGNADFASIVKWLGSKFKIRDELPALSNRTYNLVGADNVFIEFTAWFKAATRDWEKNFVGKPEARLVAAVKNCLIAADVAGSALPKKLPNDPQRWQWITQSFDCRPKIGELQKIVDCRLNGGTPRDFQRDVAESRTAITFVKAGCGSGKTLAAYMWAAKNHPTRRLYFCYPTTGTATEGFKDYLYEPDVNADLFHSRRDVDFEIILSTGFDENNADTDAAIRIDALDAWSTPIVACTVDTVLGLVQNNKRGLFTWPALAQSAFVFDEIHAYDDRLFGALLRFFRDLPGLPALLMTASLPKPREEALRNTLARFQNIELAPIAGPEDLEKVPRYSKAIAADNNPLPLIQQALSEGGKVLWVCNTVKRVTDSANAAEAVRIKPLVYHSRFKYVDRVQRHKAVIDAFDPKYSGAALAVCSQVAEMSLDLKGCTLLVTDLATVPAMIQRFGRLNRQAVDGDPARPFVVIAPENHLPYTPFDLETARAWLARLPADDISQLVLAECWEQAANNPPDLVSSAWLDGGPMTTVSELREASPGIAVLMAEDLKKVKENPQSLGKYTLPMPPPPRAVNWRDWQKHNGIPIAEPGTINYDKERGAEWQN